MTPIEKLIAEIEELDAKATAPPWMPCEQGKRCVHISVGPEDTCNSIGEYDCDDSNRFQVVSGKRLANIEFMCRSRTLLPLLGRMLKVAVGRLVEREQWYLEYFCPEDGDSYVNMCGDTLDELKKMAAEALGGEDEF